MLLTSSICTNFKDHHDIKQYHKFILTFVMPKPVSYSRKLIPSLYPNQRLKHVKQWCINWYMFDYNLSYLRLKLSYFIWTWLTAFSHCVYIFSAIIAAEYSDSMTSVDLTVYRIVFRMSVLFTFLV